MTTALGRIWITAGSVAVGAAMPGLGFSTGVVIAGAGILALAPRRKPILALVGLCLAAAGLGIIATAARTGTDVLEHVAKRIPHCSVAGRVVEQIGALGTLVAIDRARCDESISLDDPGVVVVDVPQADAGASLTGSGWLLPLDEDGFDTQRRRLGAHSELDLDDFEIGRVSGFLPSVAAGVRHGLRTATAGLDTRRSALLVGLVIGDVSGIDPSTQESLRRAGLSHLVAVSGHTVAYTDGFRGWSGPQSEFSYPSRLPDILA